MPQARPSIQILDKKISELIAAGEVVERPASVVKELLENAVDAGATAITVEIKQGGIRYIRVTDNGCGIPKNEIKIAFFRHATSKIKNEQDLEGIATLGFRGEALSSIAAVSRVELLTKVPEAEEGYRYRLEGEEELSLEEVGCPNGTSIIVRDLFFNTPARMKFLKRDVTEGNAVYNVVEKIALSHPEISLRFLRDSEVKLHTPGDGKLLSTIYAVYGREFSKNLLEVDYTSAPIQVTGYISTPTESRKSRSMQNFLLNGRYVRSTTCMAALEEAYRSSIMVGKYPACVLHIKMPVTAVDVNVHPTKMEVRFAEEKPVFEAVYQAVKFTLKNDDFKKELSFHLPKSPLRGSLYDQEPVKQMTIAENVRQITIPNAKSSFQKEHLINAQPLAQDQKEKYCFKPGPLEQEIPSILKSDVPAPELSSTIERVLNRQTQNMESRSIAEPLEADNSKDIIPASPRFIGELFATYLIAEWGDAAFLIDKHAAHERILYEKLLRQEPETQAQLLLESVLVPVSKEEQEALLQNQDLIKKMGLVLEDFGPSTIAVREAPIILEKSDISAVVTEIAQKLLSHKPDLTPEFLSDLYHSIACRAAIKANDKNTVEDLSHLLQVLANHPQIRFCPHGRPIYIKISKKEIMKQFGRLG